MLFLSGLLALFRPEPGSSVGAEEARSLLALPPSERPKLVDVRTAGEWKGGRIQGAVHIDVSSSEFDRRISALPKDGRYLLYCQSGARSGVARTRMRALGFSDVRHISGGMSAWRSRRLPVAR